MNHTRNSTPKSSPETTRVAVCGDDVVFCDRETRAFFERQGIATLATLCAMRTGDVVTTAKTRACYRIEIASRTFYVKTQDLARARLPIRKLPSYLFRGSPLEREVRAHEMLRAAGFRTPEIVAHGVTKRRFLPIRSAVVTEAVAGHVDLAQWARTPEANDDDRARTSFDCARQLVLAVHAHGLVLAGSKYRNLLVPATGCTDAHDIVLIDQPNLARSTSRRRRRKDLELLDHDRSRYGRGR
ncbi:MAG: hypothetical protein H6832_17885 [Planctomycetes bacterium]|nr:hypothetical protein [Planctomycetota bacterium]MCB9920277.1 hypothetical protein [Planctomycetota bacterium]